MTELKMKYFVLSPLKDSAYGRASRMAIRAYVREIRVENEKLANELDDWVTNIQDDVVKRRFV